MNTYQTIIVDDERLAREEVKRSLGVYTEFEVIGEAANAEDALLLAKQENPDLIFLDIHMPEKSGFDLLEELTITPEVVFTTAYDQYAVQAFEVNALDYLVKPLRDERFAKTIEKVKQVLASREEPNQSISLHQKVFIKDGEQCYFIPLSDIRLIESLDNYARLYFGEHTAMIKRSLNVLSKKVDPNIFFRINRSQIVNTQYIDQIEPCFNQKLNLRLKTGEVLEVSSRQSVKFKYWNRL